MMIEERGERTMTTVNLGQWTYELARERQQELIQAAAQQRQLNALRPATNRWWCNLQPLTLLRTWRLVTPRLHLAGPADEAHCS
jgi:hypothetical protein